MSKGRAKEGEGGSKKTINFILFNDTNFLSSHNLHHFDQMFIEARRHIAAHTFQVYKKHITQQYESYSATVTTFDNWDDGIQPDNNDSEIANEDLQAKKKIKVSED